MAKKKSDSTYYITVSVGGKTIKGSGSTALEALQSLERPTKISSKAFFKVTKGDKSTELMFMPAKSKFLFYPMAQMLWAKKFDLLLK